MMAMVHSGELRRPFGHLQANTLGLPQSVSTSWPSLGRRRRVPAVAATVPLFPPGLPLPPRWQALCCGGDTLAVDGVIMVGEHGDCAGQLLLNALP